MPNISYRKIWFKARKKSDGQFVEGYYLGPTRKNYEHSIHDEENDLHPIYIESIVQLDYIENEGKEDENKIWEE